MQIKVKRVIEKEEKGGTEEWRNKKNKKTLEKNKTTRHYLEAILLIRACVFLPAVR